MMQRGKKIPEYQAINKNMELPRKAKSPKKNIIQQPQLLQHQLQLSHAKRLKISNIPRNEFNQSSEKATKNSKQFISQQRQSQTRTQQQNSGRKQQQRKQNQYSQAYKADLKYYNEYLDSCMKMTQNGINYKWPYCFYGSS